VRGTVGCLVQVLSLELISEAETETSGLAPSLGWGNLDPGIYYFFMLKVRPATSQ